MGEKRGVFARKVEVKNEPQRYGDIEKFPQKFLCLRVSVVHFERETWRILARLNLGKSEQGGPNHMKKSSKKSLEKRGILVAGRAQNAGGAQVHADKRKPLRALEKQRLKTQLQHETARNRGPFPFSCLATDDTDSVTDEHRCFLIFSLCSSVTLSVSSVANFIAAATTFPRFHPRNSGQNRESKSTRRRRLARTLPGAAHRRARREPRPSFRRCPCRAA